MRRLAFAVVTFVMPFTLTAQQGDLGPQVDAIFAKFDRQTPGCAVGLGKDGRTLYTHGYGSANLEYGVPLTDSSVMESGSVAKQFTAAAIVLLQSDGKLSLDDDIRKYLPEVPDFGRTITIRNLLTHTSGLRDQWGLLAIEGRGPGSQVHSPQTTLDLVTHQKQLNFQPGAEYLYSNTGYALASLIVERVSGMSFQEFSQSRLFRPLGMTHTLWRDDYTKVVPNRATAYSKSGAEWRQDMPFTNMVGNGGLLSTMADLMKWNENLDHSTVGGADFTRTLETSMRLTSGRTIPYALGLVNGTYDGVREVSHSGGTAGYRTFLARYPAQRVSVAVWCSNGSVNPEPLTHQVADLVLTKSDRAKTTAAPAVAADRAALARWAGVYREARTDQTLTLVATDSGLVGERRFVLTPIGGERFRVPGGTAVFGGASGHRRLTTTSSMGDSATYEEAKPAPTSMRASDYVGRYVSDELDVVLTIAERDGKLVLRRRPHDEMVMTPAYTDDFQLSELGSVRFARDAAGKVSGFAIYAGRVRDVRFHRAK